VRAARESAVLLKNEGRVLPLAPDAKVAVVGALAGRRCRYQGAGSSLINAHGRPDFLHALVRGGCRDAAYAPGYDPDSECVDAKLEEKALNAARGADTVLLFLGLTDLFETEGYDRAHMRLPFNQLHLLDRLAGAGKDVVVVLAGGSPVETPWLPRAKAVLYTALGGEGVGEAVFQLLCGRACPAGRLAETWPKRLEDTPAARHWPMGPDAVTYNESIYVGYRYYDKAHVDVRFPFGYGLSYTSFAYSGLTLSRKVLAPGKAIEVLFTVENTGTMAGVETAQVYVAHRNSAAHQPVRTLAGFARVALKPGERKTVCVTLPPSALEFYDVARHAFVVEAGRYEVSVGRHSRCLLLHAAFTARGETVALPPAHSAGGPYGSFADNTFPDAAFAAIHTRPLPRNQKPVRGEYTQTTVLGDMLDSRTGRALHALALCAARLGMHFSNNPAVNRRVCEMTVRDLPFKNLVLNTSGIIRYPAAEALLALANGRLFSRGGTVRAERGRSRKG
jgi:glycoside hydrolase family 3 domain protein